MSVACGNITSSVTSNEPSARGTATIRIPGFVSPGPAVAGVVRGVVVVDGRELSSPGLGATGRAALPEQAAVAPAPSASATVTSNRHPVRRSSSAPVVVCGRNPGSAAGEPRPDISHPPPKTDLTVSSGGQVDLRIRYATNSCTSHFRSYFSGILEGDQNAGTERVRAIPGGVSKYFENSGSGNSKGGSTA